MKRAPAVLAVSKYEHIRWSK